TFIPTVFGGHVLVYESRSHPGHRREFAFKTRFTNQSGVSSCYYRCMSCRSMKNKVPPGPDGKPPQIPCIAVKNGYIVNDPDFPEANDHFCIPPTIEESKQKEENGFAKAIVKGRPRQKPPNDLCEEMKMNGFTNGEMKKCFDNGSTIKFDDDDSDGTTKANNLLASLISMEPALRSGLNITTHRNLTPLLVDEDNTDLCQEFRRSPESYTALVMNSLSRSDSRPTSASSTSTTITNLRKRKTPLKYVEPHLEQIFERYIINNWELPDNGFFFRVLWFLVSKDWGLFLVIWKYSEILPNIMPLNEMRI
uniref:Uncharacterized protein n=1 Tax=Parascaris equorum TaxID=6256 RepID=A0A914R4M1_PAREQ